ncbi:hypothetical protein [Sphingobium nicotianae]|uniref:DUF4148 domain-containing protein n=1 Tax=Sphingobium nicotianae TaxID=2782607 RepID=A0A9X1IRH6_9SPHN|nr:hypothetical protein [Sphingobium nicotianae]MBT2187453.1 hypothetical protein [Sphingobium nicotianae]
MLKFMTISMLALGAATAATSAINTRIVTDEERAAHEQEALIIQSPIGGLENKYWFNYRANINEARKEVVSDLRHADDMEDTRRAWDEYRGELSHERGHYVKQMAKRGFRYGTVSVGD